MTTYRKIHGRAIKSVSSNLSAPSAEGQIWFNTTDNKFRSVVATSAWASASPMLTARGYGAANGTQTASLYTGGLEPGGTYYSNTEEYNGSGWSTGGALPKQNYAAGSCGTQTAALFFGGSNNPGGITINTYTYNGSSWTATPNSLNLGRDYICGTGTQTSALAYCGRVTSPSLAVVANFEEWNGSSWTALTAAPTAVALSMGEGPETASFFASGGTNNGGPPYLSTAQEYDGSTLSTGGSVNTGRAAGGAAGDSSAGLIFGGDVGGTSQTKTETYDGTTFSEIADMSTAMRGVGNGSGATNAAALAASSYGPPALGTTEEFTTSANVITGAAWASGGNLNTTRRNLAGAGIQTSALAFGGESPKTGKTELYNGTSWSEVADLNTARNTFGGTGTSTAAIAFGGEVPGGPSSATETWDGSSWTTSPNSLNTPVRSNAGFGTTSSAINMGGFYPSPTRNATVEEWGGTSWTTVTSLPTATVNMAGFGIETAGVCAGGNTGSETGATYEWGGSSWTTGGTMNTARSSVTGGTGTATAGLVSGGSIPGATAAVEGYDGTSWSTRPSLGTARMSGSGLGPSSTQTAGLVAGGYVGPPGDTNVTEEFTGETTALNVKDLTQS